jgi:hypothetical protein
LDFGAYLDASENGGCWHGQSHLSVDLRPGMSHTSLLGHISKCRQQGFRFISSRPRSPAKIRMEEPST